MAKTIKANKQLRNINGWHPDKPDHRDIAYAVPLKLNNLPTKVDLRTTNFLPRIEDQGQLGSCTMNAATSCMEFLYKKAGKPQPELSRLFGYYAERVKIEYRDPNEDSGAQNRDAMKSLATYGVCLETTWPYDISKFSINPPKAAWKEALKHRIVTYSKVIGLVGLKSCLAEGYPVMIGFSVPESMEGAEAARTGVIRYPKKGEDIIGGHAVMAVGYDEATKLVCFSNSWGVGWGDKGFGYLPYEFFSAALASDFWTVRKEDL